MNSLVAFAAGPIDCEFDQTPAEAAAAGIGVDEEPLEFNDARCEGPQGDASLPVEQYAKVTSWQSIQLFTKRLKAEIDSDIPLIIFKEAAHQWGIVGEHCRADAKIRITWVQRPKTPLPN